MEYIDIVAMCGTRFMRVQVKASNLGYRAYSRPKYNFFTKDQQGNPLSHSLIDIVALVALDQRKVVFELPRNLKRRTTRLSEHFHDIDIERITWENAVTQILGEAYGVRSRPEVS